MTAPIVITSAFAFAPGELRLRSFASTYLAADVYRRFLGVFGQPAVHVTATDVHSIYVSPDGVTRDERQCAEAHQRYRQNFAAMGIECAIHETTDHPYHVARVGKMLHRLLERGSIVRRPARVLRCSSCGVFLPRRFALESCPEAGPKEQFDLDWIARHSKCRFCQGLIQCVVSNHWFLPLESHRSLLVELASSQEQYGIRKLLESMLRAELADWNFSRDNRVGLPIPFDPEGKSLYLWLESLVGYVSMAELAGVPAPVFKHFLAKNIVYYHGVVWPVILREGLGMEQPQFQISARGFLDATNTDPPFLTLDGALSLCPRDYLRFYVAHAVPDRMVDFALKSSELRSVCSNVLVKKVGNLLRRLWSLLHRERASRTLDDRDPMVVEFFDEVVPRIRRRVDGMQVQHALHGVLDYIGRLNTLLSDAAFRSTSTPEGRGRLAFAAASAMTMLAPVIPALVEEYGMFEGWDVGEISQIRGAIDTPVRSDPPPMWQSI